MRQEIVASILQNFESKMGPHSPTLGGRDKSSITCLNCNKKGHYFNECTKPDRRESTESGTQMMMSVAKKVEQSEFKIHQGESTSYLYHQGLKLPQEWLLLDDQSTIAVFFPPQTSTEHTHNNQNYDHQLKCRSDTDHHDWRDARLPTRGMVQSKGYGQHFVDGK